MTEEVTYGARIAGGRCSWSDMMNGVDYQESPAGKLANIPGGRTKQAIMWALEKIDPDWFYEQLYQIGAQYARGEINSLEMERDIKIFLGIPVDEIDAEADVDFEMIIDDVIAENPKVVKDYRKNPNAINRLFGEVKKRTGGTYSSQVILDALRVRLENE